MHPSDQGVRVALGAKGLTSLSFRGVEYLWTAFSFEYGIPVVLSSFMTRPDGTTYSASWAATSVTRSGNTFTHQFTWGKIKATYSSDDACIRIALAIQNETIDTLNSISVRLLRMIFSQTPSAQVANPGWKGDGVALRALGSIPFTAGSFESPAIIAIQSSAAIIKFCRDTFDQRGSMSIPFAMDGATALQFPIDIRVDDIPSNGEAAITYSIRFYTPTALPSFADEQDLIEPFRRAHPFTVNWPDRRAIGALYLASSGVSPVNNPNRWTFPGTDLSTPEGRIAFHSAILTRAQSSASIMLAANAQGMIQWDIEGQRTGPTYYGTPSLIGQLAPEMEDMVNFGGAYMPLCDAYFKIFRDAGLKVGVCVRAQELSQLPDGSWAQRLLTDDEAYLDLWTDTTYAKQRWGCSLFYIDSTNNSSGAFIHHNVFERLQAEFPDCLMMPENQTLRYYGCSAPFDSMYHHGTTRTADKVREIWPQAFSAILAPGGTSINNDTPTPSVKAERRANMVAGIKKGDIIVFNGWYNNPGTEEVKSMYLEASR